ncbi:MAG: general stress protein [Candidatus Eremiobacteraeota bacterium]|nr:general stress protein [Candidatus Eremiobacteraeota bacterium]
MKNDFETGMYYDRGSAETTVQRLHEMGYSSDEISVMMNDKTAQKEFADSTGSKAAQGAVTGAAIGGGLGAIIAGLTATGSVAAIVGTGGAAAPLVVGPLAAALAGLGAGGVTGGIIGGLVGAGIPEDRAKEYKEGLDRGGILLGVHPKAEHRDQVRSLFTPTTSGTTTETGDIDYQSSRETTINR